MVMESIIRGGFALRHPLAMLFFGVVVATVSIGIAVATFPDYASVLTVAFITVGSVPVFFRVFAHEEKAEAARPKNPATFLERHFQIVKIFSFFFLGLVVSYAFWYVFLPPQLRSTVFVEQEKNWQRISALQGQAAQAGILNSCQGAIANHRFFELAFSCIFANNAIVLAWSLVLSFFYGAGAIFLVAWNASVIGLVIGKEIMLNGILGGLYRGIGLLPHGMPEIVAYFIGAIAGGIVSATIAKKVYLKKEFQTIAQDVIAMVITAYAVLLVAALIEAYLLLAG